MGGNDSSRQLWTAVENGDEADVRWLLKFFPRTDPNYTSSFLGKNDVSVLMVASVKGYKAIVQLLLKSGANIHQTDEYGSTPLHVASSSGSNETVQILLENGADVNSQDEDGDTPLHLAASEGNVGVVESLIKYKANPDMTNKDGETPLHWASFSGYDGTVQILLENRADANIQDKDGQTPLHRASSNGHDDSVQILLENRADAIIQDKNGDTPLHKAASGRNAAVVESLIKYKANPHMKNKDGQTPLHGASRNGHDGPVQILLENRADANSQDKDGDTPLHKAASGRNAAVVESLIKYKANPDMKNKYGSTPLHVASGSGSNETVQILLENRADANSQDKDGNTPLHKAAPGRNAAVVESLIKYKANPDMKNKLGQYPHDYAYGELRQQLRTYWEECRRAPLLGLHTANVKIIKSYVVGSTKAGKTTFTRAVTGLGDASNVLERTVGIDILEADMEEVGHVKYHDVAGHDLFHTTHPFFFGGKSPLFEYVVDTDLSPEKMLADAIYWLAFILSGRAPGGPPVCILILGSRGGDESQEIRQIKLDDVTRQLREKFQKHFTFLLGDKSMVLDMRQVDSKEMGELKKQLAIGIKECLERVTNVPMICQEVRAKVLSPLREEKATQDSDQPFGQFIEKSHFQTLVLKQFDLLRDSAMYESLLFCLQEWGEIVDVGSRFVINTLWLCRSLLAPVLASKADPSSSEFKIRMNANADGTVTLEEIKAVLERFRQLYKTPAVDPRAGVDILCHMSLAFPTERKNVYRLPALIQDHKPEGVWIIPQSSQHGMVYVGIQLKCQSNIEIFSPAVMPLLQAEAANQRSEMAVIMWKEGMVVQRKSDLSNMEALVVISDKERAIHALDLICRGSSLSRREVKQFLNKVEVMTMRILDHKSPGTRVKKRYLSHKQISEHIDNPVSYSQEEVDSAKKGRGILVKETGKYIIQEPVNVVVGIDEDHITSDLQSVAAGASASAVIEAVTEHASDRWYEIGIALNLTPGRIESLSFNKPRCEGKLLALINEKQSELGNESLKSELVKVCLELAPAVREVIKQELLNPKRADQE